jgi:hypothetical protein
MLALCEQLAGAIQQLSLPLARLDGVNGEISGDLLDRLAAADRFHSDPDLELEAMSAGLAHWWEPHSGGVTRLSGQRWVLPRKPVHLKGLNLCWQAPLLVTEKNGEKTQLTSIYKATAASNATWAASLYVV